MKIPLVSGSHKLPRGKGEDHRLLFCVRTLGFFFLKILITHLKNSDCDLRLFVDWKGHFLRHCLCELIKGHQLPPLTSKDFWSRPGLINYEMIEATSLPI